MTIESILETSRKILANRGEFGIRPSTRGTLPYCFEVTSKGHPIPNGIFELSPLEIVGFKDASDATLRDLLLPEIEAILDRAGLQLLK